jgi:SAM-dependent methyltransferase
VNLRQLANLRLQWSQPCVCCGSPLRLSFPAIWDALSEEWELTPRLRQLMDEREGVQCAYCRANERVQHLTRVLLADIAARVGGHYKSASTMVRDREAQALTIAEINALRGLHRYLSRLPRLSYSEHGGRNSEDLMALSYKDGTFDYVLTSDTLEHVPNFDLALSEIRRILKPGGRHIFTIPVIWDRRTRQRAEVSNGSIIHHLAPSHHGRPQSSPDDYLVFNEFGGDVVERIEKVGFSVALVREPKNDLVVTIVATKAD